MDASTDDTLVMLSAPDDISSHVIGFVHREDGQGGKVVRVLPEMRSSIQIMMADPYWLRSREPSATWVQTPRVAFWGPKYEWCFGYAARSIKAYAVLLTPTGMAAIARQSGSLLIDEVCPLSRFSPLLEKRLTPLMGENFKNWSVRSAEILRGYFETIPNLHPNLSSAIEVLATFGGGAVARAAEVAGLSERQFRRVFKQYYGVPPKRFQRALRIDRMMRQLHPDPWEQDALLEEPVPFADQPHLIREFRAMTGLTPTDYVKGKESGDKTLRSMTVDYITPPKTPG